MDLTIYRNEIDSIDDMLIQLFCRRMEVSALIADYKQANGLPVHIPAREQEVLNRITQKAGTELAPYAQDLYECLFQLSKNYQSSRITENNY